MQRIWDVGLLGCVQLHICVRCMLMTEYLDCIRSVRCLSLIPFSCYSFLLWMPLLHRWGQVFILDAISNYNPKDDKEAQRWECSFKINKKTLPCISQSYFLRLPPCCSGDPTHFYDVCMASVLSSSFWKRNDHAVTAWTYPRSTNYRHHHHHQQIFVISLHWKFVNLYLGLEGRKNKHTHTHTHTNKNTSVIVFLL